MPQTKSSQILVEARSSCHLDEELFARLLDIEPPRWAALAEGGVEATPGELDRCAQLLGLRVRDLLAGNAKAAPMRLLLKSAYEQGRPSLEQLDATGAHRALGDFLRLVQDVAELEALDGSAVVKLPSLPMQPSRPSAHPAELRARWLRDRLDLGNERIESVRDLLTRLGILTVFVSPDVLPPAIDGACTREPRPAILVNLIGGGNFPWRTRMTLLHELAHLLFDRARGAVLFSPDRRPFKRPARGWSWSLFDGFDDIEAQADAFAACLLAPAVGVRACVGNGDPSSDEAVRAVGVGFSIGRTVAINRLADVFDLSSATRAEMEDRRCRYNADYSGDHVDDRDVGLVAPVVPWVRGALLGGNIGRARAFEYLRVSTSEPLPLDGVPEDLCAPLVRSDSRVLARAQRELQSRHPERSLHARGATKQPYGWLVDVVEGGVGDPVLDAVGHLRLDGSGQVLEDQIGARPS